MRLQKTLVAATLTLFTVGAGAGCSKTDSTTNGTGNSEAPRILAIAPSDGAGNIPTTSTISVKFNMPMDTLSVMQNMHLAGGEPMQAWMDSLSHTGGMMGGGMHQGMNMDDMMSWMGDMELPGQFHWNAARDSCEFIPQTPLAGGMSYMFMMNGSVMSAEGHAMSMTEHPFQMYTSHFTCAP